MPHRVTELHSIMPIANVASVMRLGILSHEKARSLPHRDVSLAEVQDRRAGKAVPGGLRLHEYANLYFCARNPMMYKRKDVRDRLCVLRIRREVLNLDGVVLTTGNAASDYSRFLPSPQGLRTISFEAVFAEYWTDDDPYEMMRKKSAKCAEVLIPHCVEAGHIVGAYVCGEASQTALLATGFGLPVVVNGHMFFA